MSKFDGVNEFEAINTFETIDAMAKRIVSQQEEIRNWKTLMNIFAFKNWKDPIDGSFVIRFTSKALTELEAGQHIGEACEQMYLTKCPNCKCPGETSDHFCRCDGYDGG